MVGTEASTLSLQAMLLPRLVAAPGRVSVDRRTTRLERVLGVGGLLLLARALDEARRVEKDVERHGEPEGEGIEAVKVALGRRKLAVVACERAGSVSRGHGASKLVETRSDSPSLYSTILKTLRVMTPTQDSMTTHASGRQS